MPPPLLRLLSPHPFPVPGIPARCTRPAPSGRRCGTLCSWRGWRRWQAQRRAAAGDKDRSAAARVGGGTLLLFAPLCASLSTAACPSGGVRSLAVGRGTAQGVMGKPVRGVQAWRDGQARAFGRRLCTCWETEFDGKAVVKPGAWASAPFAHTHISERAAALSLSAPLSLCGTRSHPQAHTHARSFVRDLDPSSALRT
jgi:hypothetical protein